MTMALAKSTGVLFLLHLRRDNSMSTSPVTAALRLFSTGRIRPSSLRFFSTPASRYPLQYEMVITRPANPLPRRISRRRSPAAVTGPEARASGADDEMRFDEWVERKLSAEEGNDDEGRTVMDKGKRKYYRKRRKRMYGESESDEENGGRRREESDFIELKQEVVEMRTYHKREEELYFYDAFAYPWEQNKHYKMVYQLEKKYFPDQCFDKAFLDPGKRNVKDRRKEANSKGSETTGESDERLIFFDKSKKETKDVKVEDVTEKKVEDFFKGLKKFPNENGVDDTSTEPFLSSRRSGLPPTWDSLVGTVLLVNKPKGWTSFTVCGKLRRLVNVKKVGHAGTLDPMATGLLIVCIGKATKVVDRYQGMIKGYSGVIRLGEATSTWDADSPVIQREPWEHIKDEQIKKAAASFCGEIWQVPPMFSAIKVGGERMYEKARKGESLELSPRKVAIFRFDVERSLDDRQNLVFCVTCSKGTYIRSLSADLGKALGSCAHLTALRRDSIGNYSADDAWEFQELEEEITKGYM